MVNFRYHVVSLVAVFLALGAGIIVGSNVGDDQIINRLRRDAADFSARNAELRARNDELAAQLGFWSSFSDAFVPQLVRGKLNGKSLVVVAQEGLDGRAVDQLAQTLVQAGAAKPARVILTKKWLLDDEAASADLARATSVDSSGGKPGLQRGSATKLGERLGAGGNPAADGDLLKSLKDAGFLRLDDVAPGTFPGPGSLIVTLAAGDPAQAPRVQDLLVPLVESLAASRPVVVGEPLNAKDSLTDKVRGERTLAEVVATVDHANTGPGRLSLVWAMRALLDGGKVWHYGTHRGTDGLVPVLA